MDYFKSQPDFLKGQKLLEKVYGGKTFVDNDWRHLHDAVLDATWKGEQKQCSFNELVEIYIELPNHLKEIALEWGMSDTEFREQFITYYKHKFNLW